MKIFHSFIGILRSAAVTALAGVLLCALAGCETAGNSVRQERIGGHPAVLATLPKAVQVRVAAGHIKDGDTFEAIFLALGTPDRVETTADGGETLWIYKKFYHEIGINDTRLFAPGKKRSGPLQVGSLGKRPDYLPPKMAPLGASSMTREEFARRTTRDGYDMPTPPREAFPPEPPPLPSVELEILFHGHHVATITAIPEGLAR